MSWRSRARRAGGFLITLCSLIGLAGLGEDLENLTELFAFIGDGGLGWLVPTAIGLALLFLPGNTFQRVRSAPDQPSRNGADRLEDRKADTRLPGATRKTSPTPTPAGEEEAPLPQSLFKPGPGDARPFVDTTPEALTRLYEDHLWIQAEKLVQPYIGKWIVVSAPLGNAATDDKGLWVALTIARPSSVGSVHIFMRFPPEAADDFAVKKAGDQVTALGQITDVGASTLSLSNCELVSP